MELIYIKNTFLKYYFCPPLGELCPGLCSVFVEYQQSGLQFGGPEFLKPFAPLGAFQKVEWNKFRSLWHSNTNTTYYLRAILKALKKDLDDEAACSTQGGPLKTKVYWIKSFLPFKSNQNNNSLIQEQLPAHWIGGF